MNLQDLKIKKKLFGGLENYLSELSTRAPAFIKANTAFAEPADAAHNNGGRPSLSIISTLEPG